VSVGYAPAIGRAAWLVAILVVLCRCGAVLPAPPVHSSAALDAWFTTARPDVGLLTVVRLAALVMTASLLLRTVVHVATLAVADGTRRCLDRTVPAALVGLARGLASLSLTAGVTSAPPPVAQASTEGEPDVATGGAQAPAAPGTATMRRANEERAAEGPGRVPVRAGVAASPPSGLRIADTIAVAHGDSFWSIAEEVVADRGGSIDEGSVARCWRELIAANLDNLVDPGNPDLIHPGQQLIIPPG
jgi:hypothetical protein